MNGSINNQLLIYKQITQMLEDGILNDDYKADEQVPSTTEISKVFNINPATVAKGVNRLVDEGILYKKRGIGMFVAQNAKELLLKTRRETFTKEEIVSFLANAKKLNFSKDELINIIKKSNL